MQLALFDFDGTLTRGDSLLPFLRFHCGALRYAAGLAWASPALAAYALRVMRNDVAKEHLLRRMLSGQAIEAVRASGAAFAAQRLPSMLRPDTMARLAEHRARGDACVLVSASLDAYLGPWAGAQGFAAVLCSSLDTTAEGQVTGRLHGGNCFGAAKVERVRRWLDGRQPERVVAYGDSAGDAQMLAFAHDGHWVGAFRPRMAKSEV